MSAERERALGALSRLHVIASRSQESQKEAREHFDIIRAALRSSEPQGWQPIETAPKDAEFREVLIWDGGVYVSFWNAREGEWWRGDGFALQPTHWMPLPAAPVVSPESVRETEETKP